jgi:hypothetical protein
MHSLVGRMHQFGDCLATTSSNPDYLPQEAESCTSLGQLLRVMGLDIAGVIDIAHFYQPSLAPYLQKLLLCQ